MLLCAIASTTAVSFPLLTNSTTRFSASTDIRLVGTAKRRAVTGDSHAPTYQGQTGDPGCDVGDRVHKEDGDGSRGEHSCVELKYAERPRVLACFRSASVIQAAGCRWRMGMGWRCRGWFLSSE